MKRLTIVVLLTTACSASASQSYSPRSVYNAVREFCARLPEWRGQDSAIDTDAGQ